MAIKYRYIRLEPADNGHKLCFTKCNEPEDHKLESYSENSKELVFTNNDAACRAYIKLCQAAGKGADIDKELMEESDEKENY